MSAGHQVPSSDVPGRETIMDTPTGPALGSNRRDETAAANDIRRAAKFTIDNLPRPDTGHMTSRPRAMNALNLHLSASFV